MHTKPQSTYFASAERYTKPELDRQKENLHRVQYLPKIFDAIPDVMLIVNDRRQILFANQALFDMLQLAGPEELNDERPGELFGCIHSDKGPGGCGTAAPCAHCGAVWAVLNAIKKGKADTQECRLTIQNDIALDLSVTANPTDFNDTTYYVVSIKDISHEKRRRALERIFLHDILNSVSIVISAADLLDIVDEKSIPTIKETLTHSAALLTDEIRAQQSLLEAESGELAVKTQSVNSFNLLAEIELVYKNHKLAEGRTLLLDQTCEKIIFTSDPILLRRVLENMTKNALEACQEGETVTLNCTTDENSVIFSVHNPSVMPPKIQHQVFQRSFSTKGAGRGLGTYSMRLLSERYLQGHVFFTSSKKHGTTFYASYPIKPEQ